MNMKNMECKISRYVILYNILMSSLFTLEEEPEVLHEKHILSSIDVTKNKSSKKVIRRIKKKQKKIEIKDIPLEPKDNDTIITETIIPDSIIPDSVMEYQKHMKTYAKQYWSKLKKIGITLQETPKEEYKEIYHSLKTLSLEPQKEHTLIGLENDL